jgi:hypothetical protein
VSRPSGEITPAPELLKLLAAGVGFFATSVARFSSIGSPAQLVSAN